MKPSIQQLSSAMNWAPVLAYRLIPNDAARAEIIPDGGIRLRIPTVRPRWHFAPISWIVRIPPEKTIDLDELGQQFWQLCEGGCTVESMVDQFSEEHRLSFHEARMMVTTFAVQLVQRGALAVAT